VPGPTWPTGPTGAAGPTGPAGAAGQGVPVGGTAGQVLSKINSTDYNTQWVDQTGGGGGGGDNFRVLWAPEFIPRTTTGTGVNSTETTTNLVNRDLLLFDPGPQEFAQIPFAWPTGWNTFSVKFVWSYSSGSGDVVWGAQAYLYADNTALDTAFGTAQTVTDSGLGVNIHHESDATPAITPGGTVQAGRPCWLQIYRDAANGSDTLGVDANFIAAILTKVS
jgi:hypothetical protein